MTWTRSGTISGTGRDYGGGHGVDMTLVMASSWCHDGVMDLTEYVEALRRSLTTAAAAAGEQARETARLLADTMEPAVRLTVTDALAAMAAEVTAALDGSLVDIRLRGRDPEVVVVPAAARRPHERPADDGRRRRRRLRRPASASGCPSPQDRAPRPPRRRRHRR